MKSAPSLNCDLCPRLATWRNELRAEYGASWHNSPVPSFGALDAQLLIVGLAPGLHGANRTGRPFTGDYAGIVLYNALLNTEFATGAYDSEHPHKNDDLKLINCRITNAVRCVPPANKPLPAEITACRSFLQAEIAAMHNLQHILTLGRVAHETVLKHFGLRASSAPFTHGAVHVLPNGLQMHNSYHCSQYNVFTGRMNQEMLEAVLQNLCTS